MTRAHNDHHNNNDDDDDYDYDDDHDDNRDDDQDNNNDDDDDDDDDDDLSLSKYNILAHMLAIFAMLPRGAFHLQWPCIYLSNNDMLRD